ncbi:hypothetical protein H9P43_001844 [Blastocladiella emersonii ATCC 22665]|nr:hypothetical protein H9P43_001844 [Blastocladiella emersonii ATCC 22665]
MSNIADFDDWATHVLSMHMGLPEADIREGTLPYFKSMDEAELSSTLLNFLGEEAEMLTLIGEFVARRFGRFNLPEAEPQPKHTATPVAGISYASAFQEARAAAEAEAAAAVAAAAAAAAAEQARSSTPALNDKPESERQKRKRAKEAKRNGGMTLAEFTELERKGLLNKDRRACGCAATQHELFTNCLGCGRILCMAEGPGSCFTCGEVVLSGADQLARLHNRGGGADDATALRVVDRDLLERAQANQARLLEYDATSAQRTTVIDVKADFIDYQGIGKQWLTDAERKRAERKATALKAAAAPVRTGGYAIDLDLQNLSVSEATPATAAAVDADDEDEEELLDDADEIANAVYSWTLVDTKGGKARVVGGKNKPADPSATAAVAKDKAGKDAAEGTGAFFHASLAVRPVYVDAEAEAAAAAAVKSAGGKKGKGKARRDAAEAGAPPADGDDAAEGASAPGGANGDSATKSASSSRRNRKKKSAAAATPTRRSKPAMTKEERLAAAAARAAMTPLQREQPRLEEAMRSHQATLDPSEARPYGDTDFDQTISVALRVRPILPHEVSERGLFTGIHVQNPATYIYHPIEGTFSALSLETHRFDNVDVSFGPDADTETIYASVLQPLIPFVLRGGLATALCFGQTGSGKTFTMTSLHERLPLDLFPGIADEYTVTVSYFEIYGDTVTDLLNERAELRIRATAESTVVVGALQVPVETAEEFLTVVEVGAQHRRTRATFKNDVSSRSHAVCAVSFRRKADPLPAADEDGHLPLGASTLLMVDLAGSERSSDQAHHDAVRIRETQVTNKSLATLKECIRNRYLHSLDTGKHIHIPFRTSKLTLVLKEALDPTSSLPTRTVFIGHLAPSLADSQHSLSTARYVANLKASSMDHAKSAVTGRLNATAAAASGPIHPSKWPYKMLARKIATWSNNAISLEKIIPFTTSSSTLGEKMERAARGELGRMPPWMELAKKPLAEWVADCRKQGVTEATAVKVFEKYQVQLVAGRKQDKAASENTGVILVK